MAQPKYNKNYKPFENVPENFSVKPKETRGADRKRVVQCAPPPNSNEIPDLKKNYEARLESTMNKYRENMKKHTDNKRMLKTIP